MPKLPTICEHCGSDKISCIARHNNRRKKRKVYLMKCDDCRKRFTFESELMYDHKGNLFARKGFKWSYCQHCHEELDNDTESILGWCLSCVYNWWELSIEEIFEPRMQK